MEATRTCSLDGCEKPANRPLCRMHYHRIYRYGDPTVVPVRRRRTGPAHPAWTGNDVSYRGAHDRLFHARGKASGYPCDHCGEPANDWAYDHADAQPLVGYTQHGSLVKYSGDPAHYIPLCRPCHRAFDREAVVS